MTLLLSLIASLLVSVEVKSGVLDVLIEEAAFSLFPFVDTLLLSLEDLADVVTGLIVHHGFALGW